MSLVERFPYHDRNPTHPRFDLMDIGKRKC